MTDIDIAKIKAAAEKATPELIAALHSQRQLDFDGCEVGVSRQACDEAAEFIALARTAVPALIARLEDAEHANKRLLTEIATYEIQVRYLKDDASTAYAEGIEAAAKVAENYRTVDHIAWDGHIGIFPKSSTVPDYLAHAIRALLKDKPNG